MNYVEIIDFYDGKFKKIFEEYFKELGVTLKENTTLFSEIEESYHKENMKCLALVDEFGIVAFIMYQIEKFKSSSNFFEETVGYIRELYVKPNNRNFGIGSNILKKCESEFKKENVYKLLLTFEPSSFEFYIKNGFIEDNSYTPKNKMRCLIKLLK